MGACLSQLCPTHWRRFLPSNDLTVFQPRINAVYYPNWRVYEGQYPLSFDLSTITHVLYAFASLSEDGTVHLSDEVADCNIRIDGTGGGLHAWKRARDHHHPQLKLILSIGGPGASAARFADVAIDLFKAQRMAQSARKLIEDYFFDGIDIDWEHPSSPPEVAGYLFLLTLLRASLPKPKYLLTTALPAATWCLQKLPLREVSEQVDWINLMAYDYVNPSQDEFTAHHSQLWESRHHPTNTSTDGGGTAVLYALNRAKVPARKLVLGVPLYGYSFLWATGLYQKFEGSGGREGIFEYRELPRPESEEAYDKDHVASYCVGGDGGFVTYDTAESVTAKARFVVEMDMAGLFYWHVGQDKSGTDSLVRAGFEALSTISRGG